MFCSIEEKNGLIAFCHVLQYTLLRNTAFDFHLSTTLRDLETSTQRCLVQLTVSDVSFVSLRPNTSNHNMFKIVKIKHCIFCNVRKTQYMFLFSLKINKLSYSAVTIPVIG